MWVEVATGHPAYAGELFESLTGIAQACGPDEDGTWPIHGPGNAVIGRIRPLAGQSPGRVLPVFPVPDVAASLATARDLGGSVHPAASMAGNAVHEIHDPDGHAFAITADQARAEGPPSTWPPGGLFAELVVEDLSQVEAFYAPVLAVTVAVIKIPLLPAGMSQPASGYRMLVRGKTVVAGAIESSFFLLGDSALSWLVYLEVPDIDKAVVTAVELGCRVLEPPGLSPQGRYAVIEDPDHLPWGLGVTVEIPEASG